MMTPRKRWRSGSGSITSRPSPSSRFSGAKEYVFVVDARPAPEVVQEQIRKCLGLPLYKGQAADKGEGQPAAQQGSEVA
jgi:hypothetical protein